MQGKFDAYVLWSLAKRVQNWIVDWSTARNLTVNREKLLWKQVYLLQGKPFFHHNFSLYVFDPISFAVYNCGIVIFMNCKN